MSKALRFLIALAFGAGCYKTKDQPRLAGQDVHLTVLHTSDLHSRLLPYIQLPGLIDRGLGLCAEFQPIGGAARMQYLLKRERARSGRVMHLDSGDCFQGAPIFNAFRGEVEMRVLGAFGLDAAVIGNHEFDLGSANAAIQYERWGKGLFPLLAANYLFPENGDAFKHNLGALLKPYEILNLDGLKVAIIGMGNTSSMTSIAQGGNSLGITPLEPLEALRTQVNSLQGLVDLIFVVSHMGLSANGTENLGEDQEAITGYELVVPPDAVLPHWEIRGDEPNGNVRAFVPGVSGIDAIFGGHLHIVLNPPKVVQDPSGRNVLLVHSGAFAKFFGRMDMVVRVPKEGEPAPFGTEIVSHRYSLFPVTARIPKRSPSSVVDCPGEPTDEIEAGVDEVGLETPCLGLSAAQDQIGTCEIADACRAAGDACSEACRSARRGCTSIPGSVDAAMSEMLNPYVQKLYQNEDLNRGFAYATARITRFGLSGEDAPLGNMVADAMRTRNRIEAQFAMTNTLGIRTQMEAGLVTIEQMFNIFPFENSLTTMYLSGVEVQELFDYVTARSAERGCQTQAQISGVSFVMNCAQALRNQSAPECSATEECEGLDFAQVGTNQPVRCASGRCYKSPADDIRIGGQAINPTESYKAAVNDFIGRGGSGFEVLRRNTTKVNTTLSLRDALIDYMRAKPEDGGPGRICGSKAMVDPARPLRPYVTFEKRLRPEGCGGTKPAGCNDLSGRFFDCEETTDQVNFFCIPFDFPDPSPTAGDECTEIARTTEVLESFSRGSGEASACLVEPSRTCNGQLHCCEKPIADGRFEASFYCVQPLCVDPPETGRIRRVVQ